MEFMQKIKQIINQNRKLITMIGNTIVNILFCASLLFIGFIIWHLFMFASFDIPSNSMLPTLKPGDKVLVDKISTGARLFDIFDAADGKDVKIHRTYRFRKFKRGDVMVFNYPFRETKSKIAMNYPVYYAKRCVGIPGDTLEIKGFQYFINGKPSIGGGNNKMLRHAYSQAENPDSIMGFSAMKYAKGKQWTIRDLGPLYIPKKDTEIALDSNNYMPYKKSIEWETGKKLKCKAGKLYLGERRLDSYKFKHNYYFMVGDNSADSADSRYWGFVPEEFIVGRILLIWKRAGKYGIYLNYDKYF